MNVNLAATLFSPLVALVWCRGVRPKPCVGVFLCVRVCVCVAVCIVVCLADFFACVATFDLPRIAASAAAANQVHVAAAADDVPEAEAYPIAEAVAYPTAEAVAIVPPTVDAAEGMQPRAVTGEDPSACVCSCCVCESLSVCVCARTHAYMRHARSA